MMDQKHIKPIVVTLLLFLSACTKTVYQTAPETDAKIQNDTGSLSTVPGNAAADATANNSTTTAINGSAVAPGTSGKVDTTSAITTAGGNTAEINATIAENAAIGATDLRPPAVIGEPGEIVDCKLLLPCRWISDNEDFTLTIGSSDNTGALNRLSIQYSVSASHDSELLLGNGSTALAPGGANFSLTQQSLGSGNGVSPQAILAGQTIVGSATYDREANSTSLAGWTVTIVDNGLPRTIGFINVPVGSVDNFTVNCAQVLPCQWVSNEDDITLTLVSVGGFTANGRLNVNFNIITDRKMTIVLDAGAQAIGSAGEQFEARTHSLGSQSGFSNIEAVAAEGVMLPGNVSFFRTPQPPASLQSLDLVLYEDAPAPRWNPQFINLPTQ